VLVIGAWNYPLPLHFGPLSTAIAAGNCTILKSHRTSPNFANVMNKIVTKYLDNSCYKVYGGSNKDLLKYPFDLIMFTGGPATGREVAKAAAEHLTPCILELGGKSPTIVDKDVDLEKALLAIIFGKFTNNG